MNRYIFPALLSLPSIYLFASLNVYMAGDPFPPFNDPGNWLKIAYSILGNNYPMWEQTTFQYPPFFTSLLALISLLLGNELIAVKLLGTISISMLPIGAFLLSNELSGNRWVGIASAWLVAFAPIFEEMFGWGGYPNAFGIFFLAISTSFTIRAAKSMKRNDYLLAFIFSFLTTISHHLTAIVTFAVYLPSFILLMIMLRDIKKCGALLISLSGASAGFILWRILAGPFQYVTFNAASLQIRPFDSEVFWWTFKSPLVTTLLFIASFSGIFWLYSKKKYTELIVLILLVAAPYIITQSYFVGIALDFRRFPAFSVLPLCTLASLCIMWIREAANGVTLFKSGNPIDPLIEGRFSLSSVILASIFSTLLIGNVAVGLSTQASVFQYYHSQIDYTYSGNERLDALNWIRDNTDPKAVFLADDTMGRWIEGYSHRRVLMKLDPYQSFIQGEVDRYKAADLILNSNLEISNPYVMLRDGAPYLRSGPIFYLSDGLKYNSIVYLVDAYVRVSFEKAGSRWIEAPYNQISFSISWVERSATNATAMMQYETQALIIRKFLSMNLTSNSITVKYVVTPKDGALLDNLAIPIWVPFGSSISALNEGKQIGFAINSINLLIKPIGFFSGYNIGIDNETSQQRILLNFHAKDNTIYSGFQITFPEAKRSAWRSTLDAYTSDELIKEYNVNYIVVGKYLYDMNRFYSDPRLSLAYSNSKIAIFSIKG